MWSLIPLLSVKIVYLVDRSDLFKIGNLVYDGMEIVRSLFLFPGSDKLFRDTKASSAHIFQKRIHTSNTSVNSNNREIT